VTAPSEKVDEGVCADCKGTGYGPVEYAGDDGMCRRCMGSGKEPCHVCDGYGTEVVAQNGGQVIPCRGCKS